jgi:UDP-N-acetylmuramoylalanine--D-glutamate ligase
VRAQHVTTAQSFIVKRAPKRALVLGLARSGEAAALALRSQGVEVVGHDGDLELDPAVAGRLAAAGVEIQLGEEDDALLRGIDAVIKSPGVPGDRLLVVAARARGVPVLSEIELGARLLANPLIGITGTNGKTTTTALLGAMFDAAGVRAEVVGNIGRPFCSLVGHVADDAWVVCELSSFQLEDVETLRPRIAVLLNLEPDHIDRHGSFEAYREAKLRVFERQTSADVAVVPRGFGPVPGAGRRVEFFVDDLLPAEPRLPGAHNRENAAAAVAVAYAAGLSDDAVAEALRTFPGVEHRIEELREVAGVRFVNDSKATNVAAARRAIASFDVPLHVILGGLGKHESYEPLAVDLGAAAARAYLIGAAADEIGAALAQADVRFEQCGDLASAVQAAFAVARTGDVVLLSPACASFDQFENYEQRGDEFRRLVDDLGVAR